MLKKVESFEQARNILEQYKPNDTKVYLGGVHLEMDGNTPIVVAPRAKKNFALTEPSAYNQFVQMLSKKFSEPALRLLEPKVQERVVNNLIDANNSTYKGRNTTALFRTEKEENVQRTVAVLTREYKPVNHIDLLNLIQDTTEMSGVGSFFLDVNWHYCVARVPTTKISSEKLGIFAGVQFTNGQTGKVPLEIISMLWEKICTNGMTVSRGKNTLLASRHIGDVDANVKSLPIWHGEIVSNIKNGYNAVRKISVKNAQQFVSETLPKKYKISQDKVKTIHSLLNRNDPNYIGKNETTGWNVVRAITEASQRSTDFTRYDMDALSSVIAENEFSVKF